MSDTYDEHDGCLEYDAYYGGQDCMSGDYDAWLELNRMKRNKKNSNEKTNEKELCLDDIRAKLYDQRKEPYSPLTIRLLADYKRITGKDRPAFMS